MAHEHTPTSSVFIILPAHKIIAIKLALAEYALRRNKKRDGKRYSAPCEVFSGLAILLASLVYRSIGLWLSMRTPE